MHQRVAAAHLAEARGQRRGLLEWASRWGAPGGWRGRGPSSPGSPRSRWRPASSSSSAGAGVSTSATVSSMSSAASSSAAATAGAVPRPSTYSVPSTNQSSASMRPQQPRGRGAGRQGGELAGLLAVRLGEHALGLGRGGLHEVPGAGLGGQDRGEAGREARRSARRPRRPGTRSGPRPRPGPRRAGGPLQTPGGLPEREGGGQPHPAIFVGAAQAAQGQGSASGPPSQIRRRTRVEPGAAGAAPMWSRGPRPGTARRRDARRDRGVEGRQPGGHGDRGVQGAVRGPQGRGVGRGDQQPVHAGQVAHRRAPGQGHALPGRAGAQLEGNVDPGEQLPRPVAVQRQEQRVAVAERRSQLGVPGEAGVVLDGADHAAQGGTSDAVPRTGLVTTLMAVSVRSVRPGGAVDGSTLGSRSRGFCRRGAALRSPPGGGAEGPGLRPESDVVTRSRP